MLDQLSGVSSFRGQVTRFFTFRLISFFVLVIFGLIFSGESTRWADWDLGWPLWAYPCCVAGAWTLAGLIVWHRAWPAILISGPIAGVGGWGVTYLHLQAVESTFTIIEGLLYLLGALPGVGVFVGIIYLLARFTRYKLVSDEDPGG